MRINQPNRNTLRTHEGAPAKIINAEQRLRRSVLSCLLWEDGFYEDGQSIAERVTEAAAQVKPRVLADLAIEARTVHNLRHVPLLLLSVLAKTGAGSSLVSRTIAETIIRPDELAELLAVHARVNGVAPNELKPVVSAQMKKGLAAAFRDFDEYQLAKYDRAGAVRLRDALRLCHAKPRDAEQAALWKRLSAGELATPDTWEVALSGGADKKETFERLLRDGKLGYLALLRNLRNMAEAGVDLDLVRAAIIERKGASRVLPFRYVAAARACPHLEPALDEALCDGISGMKPLNGLTAVLVDVSGSMEDPLSKRSDLTRMDAAAVLASIIPGQRRVFAFSNEIREVAPRTGMAGVDAIKNALPHGGTYLGSAVNALNRNVLADRLIVITDEQIRDQVPDPVARHAYMINVGTDKNGVGYGRWTHIDGFSESVLRFIVEIEQEGR